MALVAIGVLSSRAQPPSAAAAPSATPASGAPAGETVKLENFVVTGTRASVISAIETKREKLEIVDSIVASDINKLPDYNVTDALQRITGIQILRDRGEGAGVSIRGLTQTETALNGREVFTAGLAATGGASRTIDFADVPAEMVAAINVYKTASADHIEGGIGGLVDLVTRRPFDFKGLEAVGSVRLIRGDLVRKTKAQYSGLFSDRIKLAGGGEIGALVNVSYQERAWREDQKGTGTPAARTDLVTGQTITTQNSTSESTVFGRRERTGATGVIQWRPTSALEFYAEGNYTKFNTLQDTNQINATGTGGPVAGSVVLAPGTTDLQKITWASSSVSVLSFARDTHDWTKQFAGGAIWRGADLTLKFDASYTDSYNDLFFSGPFFAATAGQFSQDFSSNPPGSSIAGTKLTDPAIYRYTGIAYRYRPFHGKLTALTLDGTYKTGFAGLESVAAGFRAGSHKANNKPGLIFADFNYPAGTGPQATTYPDLITTNTYGFLPNQGEPSLRSYMTGVLSRARDVVPYRGLFNITTPLPASASPLTLWDINEKTAAGYLLGRFKTRELPLDGNLGVRFVRTQEVLSGNRTVPATPTTPQTTAPLNLDTRYNSVLPSLNARYAVQPDLFVRVAASKTLTRPDFGQLSPSLTLVPNPVNPALNQGSAGNPDLRPIRSDNLDVAVEKYFGRRGSIYATFFHKKVNGFIVSSAATETYDGQSYLITRPRNANPATIKGYEVGATQFFDGLPGAWRGLGVQANYTYIDSQTPNATLGTNTPLPNLSRKSYNVIAMYELNRFSARLAYNWRDKFLSGQANIANVGRIPFYTKAYGWMDASLSYQFTEKFAVTLEGTNLLRTERVSYYGVPTRPQNFYVNDRQFSVSATLRY